jgi:chromosome segregation ATPase
MSDPKHATDDSSAEDLREEIAQTRAELADTVDQLSDKLDVKQHAADRLTDAKQKVTDTAHKAKQSAPEPVQRALDTAGAKAGPVVHDVAAKAAPHRSKIVGGLVLVVAVLVVFRRRRADR